ncbi:MAG: HEAT repeat protein [Lentimonas sp.]|jgi:HEAT repeat protein
MDPDKKSSLTKMDKIRIVVEYSELSEDEKADYLKKNGIDQEKLKAYQQEAVSVLGAGMDLSPPRPKTRCEELIEELTARNDNVRKDAARALGYMRHRATLALNALIERMLNDPIDFVRSWSAWAITRIEPRNPDAIEAFIQSLNEDEHAVNVRNWCVVGLSASESDHVQNCMIKVLKTGKPFAQFSSIEVLSRMCPKSPEFIEGLKMAANSENQSLQELANLALSKMQPKA